MSHVRFTSLYSELVKAFLPADTWTEVTLLSQTPINNEVYPDVYACSTDLKIKERKKIMDTLSNANGYEKFEKIEKFRPDELVAVEIDNKWHRGKMISFNEFFPDFKNTFIELIDDGSFYTTNIENVYALNYFQRCKSLVSNPKALFIKFKNFVPKTKKLYVKPLFAESILYDGYVLVDAKLEDVMKKPEKLELAVVNGNGSNITNGFNSPSSIEKRIKEYAANAKPSWRNGGFSNPPPKLEKDLPIKSGDFCILTWFDNLMSIFVCPGDPTNVPSCYKPSDAEFLKKISANTDFIPKSYPTVGDLVKVLSPEYGGDMCFRAVILNRTRDDKYYGVFYIDFGNIENVPPNVIFELDDALKDKPGMAVKVGMKDLIHIKCTDKIKEIFKKSFEQLFVIEFNEESKNLENVKLKDTLNGIYINDMVLQKHSECMTAIQDQKNTTMSQISKSLTNEIKQPINLKNKETVYLKCFESMDCIYILRATDAMLYNETVLRVLEEKSDPKTDVCAGDIVKIPEFLVKVGIKKPFLNKTMNLVNYVCDCEKIPLCLEFDENDSNGYDQCILRRIDNSENIFEEFLKTTNETLVLNGVSSQEKNNEILKVNNDNISCDFESINLENGDYCIITHFESFNSIYVCKAVKDSSNTYVVHNLDIAMRTLASEDREVKVELSVGDFVKVLSPRYKDFYRAKIINIIDNTKFQVSFIDFGNDEIVQSSDIFELSDELKIKTKLPSRVSIDVPPNARITEKIENYITSLSENSVVLSINYKTKNSTGPENVVFKEIESGKSVNKEILKLLPVERKIPLKNCNNWVISYFENFDSIYVLTHENDNSQIIFDTASSLDRTIQTNISVGDLVKVHSLLFEDLFRAKVMNFVDKENLKVYYIDFGSTEVVPKENVFELSENLKIKPGIAIKVGIKMPNDVIANEKIRKFFTTLGDKLVPLSIEFDDSCDNGLENCTIKMISNGMNLYDEIIKLSCDNNLKNEVGTVLCDANLNEEVLKLSNQPPVFLDKKKHNKTTTPQVNNETVVNEVSNEHSFESELTSSVEFKSGDIVFCCNFEDFKNVYLCKRSKNDASPENVKFISDASIVDDTIKKINPRCEDLVRVKFEDKIFRARVLEKHDELYTVLLIDIGNKIKLLGDNIYELSDHLKNIPGLAKKVGLKGAQDFNVTKAVMDYFQCLWHADKIPLILTYEDENFNYINEVSLKKLNDGRDIIEDLKNISKISINGPQTNDVKLERNLKINGSINNRHVASGDHVEFLHGLNVENIYVRCIRIHEEFKNIIDELRQEKRENFKVKERPQPRDAVAVFCTKIKGMHRAIYVNNDGNGKFKCRLVDIGVIDWFPPQQVFELPVDLYQNKVPFLAHKVSLKGFSKNHGFNCTEISSYLSTMTGKTFIIEFEKNGDSQWNSQVVLKELQSNESLNEKIKKIPVNSVPISQRLEKKIIRIETNGNEIKKKLHPIESGSCAILTNFEDFNSIFIRSTSAELNSKFGELNKQMIALYRNATGNCSKTALDIGDKVCVKSSYNKTLFSRASIINKFGDEYNVFHVDYGNTELVSAEDIFELPKELKEIPDFAIKVKFNNVPQMLSVNNFQAVKDYVKKKYIASNAMLRIEFNELNPEGLNDVILKTDVGNKNIAHDLLKLFSDLPLLNIKPRGNTPGKNEQQGIRPPNSPYLARKNSNNNK